MFRNTNRASACEENNFGSPSFKKRMKKNERKKLFSKLLVAL